MRRSARRDGTTRFATALSSSPLSSPSFSFPPKTDDVDCPLPPRAASSSSITENDTGARFYPQGSRERTARRCWRRHDDDDERAPVPRDRAHSKSPAFRPRRNDGCGRCVVAFGELPRNCGSRDPQDDHRLLTRARNVTGAHARRPSPDAVPPTSSSASFFIFFLAEENAIRRSSSARRSRSRPAVGLFDR